MKQGHFGLRSVLRSMRRSTRNTHWTLRDVRAYLTSNLHDLGVDRRDPIVFEEEPTLPTTVSVS